MNEIALCLFIYEIKKRKKVHAHRTIKQMTEFTYALKFITHKFSVALMTGIRSFCRTFFSSNCVMLTDVCSLFVWSCLLNMIVCIFTLNISIWIWKCLCRWIKLLGHHCSSPLVALLLKLSNKCNTKYQLVNEFNMNSIAHLLVRRKNEHISIVWT